MKKFERKYLPILVSATMGSAVLHPGMASAQGMLEEVVVTAQKRAESLQDVPIAITAFSESQLEDSGFDNISDLANMSPSVQFGNFGPVSFVTMRGIGNENTTAGGDPGVALHLDGIYMGRPVAGLFSAFDVERVELLRGPQGTLYGRNATGGSINLISKKPSDEFGGTIDVTYGDYDWARVRGAVNLPISDSISARLVGFNEERDGYTENRFPGGKDANDIDDYGLRGHLNIDFSENASLLLSASYIESGGVGTHPELREPFPGSTTGENIAGPPAWLFVPGGPTSGVPSYTNYIDPETGEVAVNDLDPFEESNDVREWQDNEFMLLSATFEWDFDGFSFKSITGYVETEFETHQDESQSELNLLELVLLEETEQFSQEFQLLSNGDGPLDWIVGLYYFDEDAYRDSLFLDGRYDIIANALGVRSGFYFGGDVESESVAVFGQGTYRLSDDLSLTAGIR